MNPRSRLSETSPRPLYEKVKAYITERIQSGDWTPETMIPSENKLVTTLGVSRMTINRALRELTTEGRLVRLQGVGTFVANPKPRFALLEIKSIAEEIRNRGGVHTSVVHLLAEEPSPPEISAALDLAPGAPVFHAVLVHRDRDLPIQLADRYVNPSVAPEFLNQDFTRMTPNEYLVSVAPISEAEHSIEAVMPDDRTRGLLEIDGSEPCLMIQRRTWAGDRVATQSRFICPGSRYRLGGRFKPSSDAQRTLA